MDELFLPPGTGSDDDRRDNKRVYVPVRVVVPTATGDVEGRVLDASPHGLRLELERPVPEEVVHARLTGWSRGQQIVNLRRRWQQENAGERTIVGAIAPNSLAEVIRRERAAYEDMTNVVRKISLPQEILVVRATQAAAHAGERLGGWIDGYTLVGERPNFLWGWVLNGIDALVFPGVDSELMAATREAKFLLAMLDTVVDDVADDPEISFAQTSVVCDAIFRGRVGDVADPTLRARIDFGVRLRSEIERLVERLPHFPMLREMFTFDLAQLDNVMRFSSLTNQVPQAGNLIENTIYQAHNMVMIAFGTIDLMACSVDPMRELGLLRELLFLGQLMGRVGNAVTTWRREVIARDFTSSFFALLAGRASLSVDRLSALSLDQIEALNARWGAESELLERWRAYRNRARATASKIRGLPAHDYVDGLERLLGYHLASVGLK